MGVYCRLLNYSTSPWWLSSFCVHTASRYSLCSTRTLRSTCRIFYTRYSTIPISACFRTLGLMSTSWKVRSYRPTHCDSLVCIFFQFAHNATLQLEPSAVKFHLRQQETCCAAGKKNRLSAEPPEFMYAAAAVFFR